MRMRTIFLGRPMRRARKCNRPPSCLDTLADPWNPYYYALLVPEHSVWARLTTEVSA